MTGRYKVEYDGPRTRIVECDIGEWARWNLARVAAIEHLEEIVTEAQATLDVLRRSGNYTDYSISRAVAGREQESHDVRFVFREDKRIPEWRPTPSADVSK